MHEIEKQTKKAEAMASSHPQKPQILRLLENQSQKNTVQLEYQKELRDLQARYNEIYSPLFVQREPLTSSIPGFWLTVLKNHTLTYSHIEERDEKLLKHLTNVAYTREADSDNFTLTFTFAKNEFMENTQLSKRYIMVSSDEMERAEGTEIVWKGENLTQKVKKVRRKKRGKQGTKVVDCLSFFNFFKNVTMPGTQDLEDMDESLEDDIRDSLEEDYDLASEFRDDIIPNALLYYLKVRGEDLSDDDEAKPAKIDAAGSERSQCKNQ